ncbi:hypothetical protein VC83_04146 [Pseudogymnoascus destructans]|uniref:Uncharacterized protein n=2 Tax=Pseudogymnoascus destructans TaxID=655981 RepID=L8FY66_PSED2|nr:uncharacterized protein VC83_04146 [Pseudogymnoascus destructans]ELR04601.1 hypothetical protein GMDG_06883 [Pseudogymnoascus destructans 20631-21]OAF59351.1 hypothetical protein VC83_04146 [Pseudogymnoascus destructans]
MPALTVDTTSPNSSPHPALRNGAPPYAPHNGASPQHSRPSSPPQPPYSPITPTLAAARLDTNVPPLPQQPLRTYTHSRPDATFIPPPPAPVEVIDFDSNTDVLAVKSAISLLQLQKKKAAQDIRTLQRFKNLAMQDPEAFLRAADLGEIRTDGDATFPEDSEEGDEYEVDRDVEMNGMGGLATKGEGHKEASMNNGTSHTKTHSSFPPLPVPQKVVKVPPINWAQYGVIGDSLDKLHNDQLQHPTPGSPARLGPDGQVLNGYTGTEFEMRDPSPQSPAGTLKGTGSPAKKPGKAAPPAKKKGR